MTSAAGPIPIPTVHATAVLLGAAGVLLRGPSGTGKSTAALALIDAWTAQGDFAALIADDRVLLQNRSGRIVARAPPSLAGLVEIRGLGIRRAAHEVAGVVRLIVDLVPESQAPRMPESHDLYAELLGVTVPRLRLPPDAALHVPVSRALAATGVTASLRHDACVCVAT